jgi:hypothetical protein
LQALSLRCLELGDDPFTVDMDEWTSSAEDFPPLDPGCFPDFSAMPCLERLTLSGELVLESELWKLGTAGSASLQVLELHDAGDSAVLDVPQMLSNCPALTRLSF